MEYLFSYGTLQLESVQLDTFARKLEGHPDSLRGYKLSYIKIEDEAVVASSGAAEHPIITHTHNAADRVEGMVFTITEAELQQADQYEVSAYKRVNVVLESGRNAWVYIEA
jgi:gamma-glutamylcyclotransferase (GGCT)/AIG2-like uncharacterized protein YtfP